MIRRPPRSTRTDHTLSLHDALPICRGSGFVSPWTTASRSSSIRRSGLRPMCRKTLLSTRYRATWERSTWSPATYRSEEHTSELQSLMRISYAVFCLTNKNHHHLLSCNTNYKRKYPISSVNHLITHHTTH